MAGQAMHSPISRPDSVGSVHSTTSDSASSSISAGRGPRRGQDICVSEELKIAIDLAFERFKNASPDDFTGRSSNVLTCKNFDIHSCIIIDGI